MKIFKYTLLFFIVFLNAQTHRFIYEFKYKRDSTEEKLNKDIMYLDVNKDKTLYYNRVVFVIDSLSKNNGPMDSDLMTSKTWADFSIHQIGSDNYETYELLEYDMLKMISTDRQDWKLSTEKKMFQNFSLQKATTHWGGRNWTAWFASDIPFHEGPYKFHNLPGLIVEVNDDKGNFSFTLVKSEKFDQTQAIEALDFRMKNAVLVDEKKYIKAKIKFYADPLAFINKGDVDLKDRFKEAVLSDGTRVNKDNIREVIAIQQKNIRKYNNPIEKDKIIHYPEK